MLSEERQKDLESAISQIERQFGQGSIMKMDGSTVGQFPSVSSGNLAMDIALGIGGLPRGRIIEIYGPEASGKTTLALCAIAEVQKTGGVAAFMSHFIFLTLLARVCTFGCWCLHYDDLQGHSALPMITVLGAMALQILTLLDFGVIYCKAVNSEMPTGSDILIEV